MRNGFTPFTGSLLACTLVATSALPAFADEPNPSFSYGKKDDVKDVKDVSWTGKAEAGLVSTTGNSRTTTATGSVSVTRKDPDNKLDLSVAGTYARATTRIASDVNGDGVLSADEIQEATATSAENVGGKLRYDRYLTELNSLYVAALAAVDKPAGKAFQGGGQLGYSRSLYKTEKAEATAEIGYDLSYLKIADDGSTTIHSARLFTGFKGKVNTDSVLEASIEGLFNLNTVTIGTRDAKAFKDTRINFIAALNTALSKKITFSISFTAKFDNFPAPLPTIGDIPYAPGFQPIADKLDTITKASLIVTFL